MSKVCQVTGKAPQSGNNVSHANNRTKRRFFPNLHTHKFWVESENRFVSLKVSAKGMRIIDKKGISQVLKETKKQKKKTGVCFLYFWVRVFAFAGFLRKSFPRILPEM